jgi:hypothetical protein
MMKKINFISDSIILAIAFVGTLSFNSCKKEDDNKTTPPSTTGTLMFHLHTYADTNEVTNYNQTYVMTGGRRIVVTTAQLYLSNIKLIKSDGTEIEAPSINLFMHQGTEDYEVGDVPQGDYKSVHFDAGLSDEANATIHTSTDQALNQSSMWFSATPQPDGFVFINFQGKIDTTAAGTGTNLIPFVYKIGTTAHRVTISMPVKSFTVTANQTTTVHIIADYAKLLYSVQLNIPGNLSLTTAAQNAGTLAEQMSANINNLFDYE